ncbi:MAG TPA: methyltransferase domain-containing protein, partial [Candidatus Binatia bacterium]|nr:methyltransferase domain-containing protein [Candidatus Binatia bacterium]
MADAERQSEAERWSGPAGEHWVANQTRYDRMLGDFGVRAIEALAPAPGERVLDLGCGCGTTTLELARRVGPSGTVLGVDLS